LPVVLLLAAAGEPDRQCDAARKYELFSEHFPFSRQPNDFLDAPFY
jgi:hypothetical protein